jgi:hypothetical protein
MFARNILFPIGLASSAITAIKSSYNSNAIKRSYFRLPFSLIALAQMKSSVQLSTISISKKL